MRKSYQYFTCFADTKPLTAAQFKHEISTAACLGYMEAMHCHGIFKLNFAALEKWADETDLMIQNVEATDDAAKIETSLREAFVDGYVRALRHNDISDPILEVTGSKREELILEKMYAQDGFRQVGLRDAVEFAQRQREARLQQ